MLIGAVLYSIKPLRIRAFCPHRSLFLENDDQMWRKLTLPSLCSHIRGIRPLIPLKADF